MATSPYIESNPTRPRSLDYDALRKEGLQIIEDLAGKVWTDYNAHDPGITILEALCYGLTDLAYRSTHAIEDIVAEPKGAQASKPFFTAREILPCNPLTIRDYRKMLVDLEGVKHAWMEKSSAFKVGEAPLNGLYDVHLELGRYKDFDDLNDTIYILGLDPFMGIASDDRTIIGMTVIPDEAHIRDRTIQMPLEIPAGALADEKVSMKLIFPGWHTHIIKNFFAEDRKKVESIAIRKLSPTPSGEEGILTYRCTVKVDFEVPISWHLNWPGTFDPNDYPNDEFTFTIKLSDSETFVDNKEELLKEMLANKLPACIQEYNRLILLLAVPDTKFRIVVSPTSAPDFRVSLNTHFPDWRGPFMRELFDTGRGEVRGVTVSVAPTKEEAGKKIEYDAALTVDFVDNQGLPVDDRKMQLKLEVLSLDPGEEDLSPELKEVLENNLAPIIERLNHQVRHFGGLDIKHPFVVRPDDAPVEPLKLEISFPEWHDPGILEDFGVDRGEIDDFELLKLKPIRRAWDGAKSYIAWIRIHFEGMDVLTDAGEKFPKAYIVDSLQLFIEVISPVHPDEDLSWAITQDLEDQLPHFIHRYNRQIMAVLEVGQSAKDLLLAHRNIGEDIHSINKIKEQWIMLRADIILDISADVNEVEAEIFRRVDQFLSPQMQFHSLHEMMEMGKQPDEIFQGPLLQHGFITDEALQAQEHEGTILVSDLVHIILDVTGVQDMGELKIAAYQRGDEFQPDEPFSWERNCLQIADLTSNRPRVSVHHSRLQFQRGNFRLKAAKDEVAKKLHNKRTADYVASEKNRHPQSDLDFPKGTFMDLADYFPLREEFPQAYGIGAGHLSARATTEQRASAKQLKGYLFIYEQIMANFLAMLAAVKHKWAIHTRDDAVSFFQSLIESYGDILAEDYSDVLKANAVPEKEALDKQRLQTLDHLLARFSEAYLEHAHHHHPQPVMRDPALLIEEKTNFLKAYPVLSRDRNRAFNYTFPAQVTHYSAILGSRKSEEIKQRVDRVLGFTDHEGGRFTRGTDENGETVDRANVKTMGFYLVEHQLLHPNDPKAGPPEDPIKHLEIAAQPDDPYSHQLSFVLPNFGATFEDKAFREEVEKRIHAATNSQAIVYIHWLNGSKMWHFENRYIPWLKNRKTKHGLKGVDRQSARTSLIEYVNNLFENSEVVHAPTNLQSANISGLKKRIYQFLGFNDYERVRFTPETGGSEDDAITPGFHLVEHLLLRPKDPDTGQADPRQDALTVAAQTEDPYSLQLSFILPNWGATFGNEGFRDFVENLIRRESAAHFLIYIHWLDFTSMQAFENSYFPWLKHQATANGGTAAEKKEARKSLAEQMNTLFNNAQ